MRAALLNVDSSCVLPVENTSRGLGLVATSLPLAEGDNALVDDLEFLSATVSWRAVGRQRRVEIRPVKTQGGRVLPEDFARVADNRTRVLILSSRSHRFPLRPDGFRSFSGGLGCSPSGERHPGDRCDARWPEGDSCGRLLCARE